MTYLKTFYFDRSGLDNEDLIEDLVDDTSEIISAVELLGINPMVLKGMHLTTDLKAIVETFFNIVEMSDRVVKYKKYVQYLALNKHDYKYDVKDYHGLIITVTIDFGSKELYEQYLFEERMN